LPVEREPFSLRMEGRAAIGGAEVVRPALPAENMMQAFFYWHLVPADDLKLAIRRGNTFRTPVAIRTQGPVRFQPGDTLRLTVEAALPANNQVEKLVYELSDPPAGIELRETTSTPGGAEIVLACDPAKAKPGDSGNLIIAISGDRKPAANGQPAANRQRIPLGSLPAIPYEIAIR
jgi:hypothetical protein